MLIFFDDFRCTDLGVVGIGSGLAESPPSTQEIPALVEFHLDHREPLPIGIAQSWFVQPMFFVNEFLNMTEH